MEDFGTDTPRDDIYSKSVRAGKRTYFFDVKSTRSKELYLTITESKRRFNQQTGKFFYEKHKLFLYREDFDKFKEALTETFAAIGDLQGEIIPREELPPLSGEVGSTDSAADGVDKQVDPDSSDSEDEETSDD